jgi:crotonobetainyl-CoA:carnitine CoA-transferase CaiB-like acyl-CoA transferase
LTRPEFETAALRAEHEDALARILTGIFKQRTAAEWERLLSAAGLGCAEVAPSLGGLAVGMFDPGNVADQMGWLTTVTHPIFGDHPRTTQLVTLSRSGAVLGAGEQIGGHTRAVLQGLGYSDIEIDKLRAAGIVTWP